MSLKSREARKLAAAGLFAAAALGAAAAPANAAVVPPKTLKYTCKYPLVDKQPLSILVTSNIPTEAKLNELQPAFVVNAVATAGGNTSQAITTLNAQAIDGVSQATASLHFPSGFVQEDLAVDLAVEKWIRPAGPVPNPLVLNASGSTPAVVLDEVGDTDIVLDRIALNLRALKADGTPINVKKLTSDFDGNPVPVDTTPEDFNVYCKLDAGESNIIATIKVCEALPCDGGGTNTAPSKVAGLAGTTTKNSVSLTWDPSTDAEGDAVTYKVYEGSTVVATTSSTSATISGLAAGSTHTYDVEAVDAKGAAAAKTSITKTTEPDVVVDTTAPSVPGDGVYNPDGSDIGETELTVRWGASTDEAGGSGLKGYIVELEGEETFVPAGTTSKKYTGLGADSDYYFYIRAVDNAGNESATHEEFLVTRGANKAPSVVTGLKTGAITDTSIALSWTASTDPEGDAISYKVYEGNTVVATVSTASATITGLAPGSSHTYSVEAVDSKNAAAAKSATVSGTTTKSNAAPSTPTNLKAGTVAYNSVPLTWTASTDPNAGDVVKYNVYRNGVAIGVATGASYTDNTAVEKTTYKYAVEAFDQANAKSAKTAEISVTTPAKPVVEGCPEDLACLNYTLKGSTTLKTLTKGSLPLTGGIKAQADFSTGNFTADLTLNNTSGRLQAGGFLPITAKVGFVPMGKTTGKLLDATATTPSSIETNSKVRIKVLEVKLFGAIPLAGGNNCQTKSVSDINLKSTNAFDPFKGGSIAGTYKISDLNGCGILNGIVSPLTAGGGNTINLDLTYKP